MSGCPCPHQLCSLTAPLHFQEEPQLWEFSPSLIFKRTESFLHRLKTIEVTALSGMEPAPFALGLLRVP